MSTTVYPVIPVQPFCDDYTVWVNGKEAALNTARVSAFPLNRRWPGYQRNIDQTEIVQFLSMAADGAVTFEIFPREPFDAEKLRIRPRSLGIIPEVTADGAIRFTLSEPAYFTVEPYGRRRALHIFVDRPCDYGVSPHDENVMYFGAGEHDVGQIELKSGQTLYLDEGAVVYACVRALDAQNIRILGHGILDNSRNHEKILFDGRAESSHIAVNNARRQHTVQLEYCQNILIDGITIRDSLVYNIRPLACEDLCVRNVKVIGCWRYNSDGIDMHNCKNVHIDHCFLRTYDDCICVKGFDCFYEGDVQAEVEKAMNRGGKLYNLFHDVLVENCVLWNDWGKCLEIGAETRADEIFNIRFRNCDLIHLTGSALDCMNVDYADVHDVSYEDIRVEADEIIPAPVMQEREDETYRSPDKNYMPYLISATVNFHHEYSAGGQRRGHNRNFTYRNIHLYGDHPPKIRFAGYDDSHKTENMVITNIYHNDRLVEALGEENQTIGDFADSIIYQTTEDKHV